MPCVSIHDHHMATVSPSFQIPSPWNNPTYMPGQGTLFLWGPWHSVFLLSIFSSLLLSTAGLLHILFVHYLFCHLVYTFLNLCILLRNFILSIVYFVQSSSSDMFLLLEYMIGSFTKPNMPQINCIILYLLFGVITINPVTQAKKVEVTLATFLSFIHLQHQVNNQPHSLYLQSIWVYINIKCTTINQYRHM